MILQPMLAKNDRRANILIFSVSIIVFVAVTALSSIQLQVALPFDVHYFASINAVLNTAVAILLVAALLAVKSKHFKLHKMLMLFAIILSVLFLLSYIAHHLLTTSTKFGDINHDNIVSAEEKSAVCNIRTLYYILLLTHIPLAGLILPFILFTAYRALIGEYTKHKKLARFTWPVWFFVAVSGVIVYVMISPYYG